MVQAMKRLSIKLLCLGARDMSNPPSVQKTTTATSNLGTTYTVTNTNDDGEGSLRWAITQSNDNPVQIPFHLILRTDTAITPLSALPEITSSVLIDVPVERIRGNADNSISGYYLSLYQPNQAISGLVLSASDSTVRGLIITQFSSYGIRLINQGNNVFKVIILVKLIMLISEIGNNNNLRDWLRPISFGNGEGGI